MMWKCDSCGPPCTMRTAGAIPECLSTHLHKSIAEWVPIDRIKKKWVVDI